ncbi:MAG TPA: protein translocase subunit SecF, partial [Rhodothermales bacterium]|nr:protein translocase subunit SecF [Rhodothermales bacterium]
LSLPQAREALAEALGGTPEVKRAEENLLVRTDAAGDTPALRTSIEQAIPGARVLRTDDIAPRFAADLQQAALYAVLAGVLVIFAYVIVRFEWKSGVGAIVSLVHDVLFVLSLFSLLHGWVPFSLAIDQTTIAAFLTIVGYSINDTVVVFDRIREDRAKYKNMPIEEVSNRAMNETLSRTILTGGSVILVLLVLFIFGGETLRGFTFAMLMGTIIGTYSSVFIATPVMIDVTNRVEKGRGQKAPAPRGASLRTT